ncbi:hypothetical protein F8153_00125 [Alkaliphilus serpentinus]|uniref:Uncharacterized protein n=1 Tax=Alkaliphilus serpentinus TaxID=1482731 RepID=A0A833M8S3_9FIRM|nr:hypothetical protein F8153_00125 [Alkaliphilus serpentinus]
MLSVIISKMLKRKCSNIVHSPSAVVGFKLKLRHYGLFCMNFIQCTEYLQFLRALLHHLHLKLFLLRTSPHLKPNKQMHLQYQLVHPVCLMEISPSWRQEFFPAFSLSFLLL